MNLTKSLFLSVLFLSLAATAEGPEPVPEVKDQKKLAVTDEPELKELKKTAYQVMKEVYADLRKHKNKEFDTEMSVHFGDSSDKKSFNLKSQSLAGSQKSLITIYKPSDIKGLKMLSADEQGEKLQYMYFPAFKRTETIKADKMGDSFMGSDFSNEDMRGRDLSDDNYAFTKPANETHYFIQAIPKDASKTSYSKINYKVNKQINLIEGAVFFDKEGKKIKTLSVDSVRKIAGVYMATKSTVVSHTKEGRSTVMKNKEIDVSKEHPESVFTLQELRK